MLHCRMILSASNISTQVSLPIKVYLKIFSLCHKPGFRQFETKQRRCKGGFRRNMFMHRHTLQSNLCTIQCLISKVYKKILICRFGQPNRSHLCSLRRDMGSVGLRKNRLPVTNHFQVNSQIIAASKAANILQIKFSILIGSSNRTIRTLHRPRAC